MGPSSAIRVMEDPEAIERHVLGAHIETTRQYHPGRIDTLALFYNFEQAFMNPSVVSLNSVERKLEEMLVERLGIEDELNAQSIPLPQPDVARVLADNILYKRMLLGPNTEDSSLFSDSQLVKMLSEKKEQLIRRHFYKENAVEAGFYQGFYALLQVLQDELEPYVHSVPSERKETVPRWAFGDFSIGINPKEGEYEIPLENLPLLQRKFAAIRDDVKAFTTYCCSSTKRFRFFGQQIPRIPSENCLESYDFFVKKAEEYSPNFIKNLRTKFREA